MQFFRELSGKDYGQTSRTGCRNQIAVQIPRLTASFGYLNYGKSGRRLTQVRKYWTTCSGEDAFKDVSKSFLLSGFQTLFLRVPRA